MAQSSIKKNSIYNAIKTISSVIFPLITFPYISRVLTPEYIGKINFSISIVSYFSLVATLGISTYAIRECSGARDDKEKLGETASQLFSINIVTTTISYVGLFIVLAFSRKLDNYRVLILIQSLTIVAGTLGADWLNSAMEDFRFITIRSVLFQLVSLVLMFVFVHGPEDYVKYALIALVSSAGANIVNIWHRQKYCKVRMIWNIREIEWRKHLSSILFLFVMILSQSLFNNIDVTMLGFVHGDVQVGWYSTAQKMSNIIVQLIVSTAWVVMPRISNYFARQDFDEINSLLSRILGYFALMGIPFIVGTICVSQEIILIVAGQEYVGSILVLQVLMAGYLFDLFGNSFIGNIICLPLKQEKKYAIIWAGSTIVNVVLNIMLIPMYGAFAAALATAISYVVSFFVLAKTLDERIVIRNKRGSLVSPIVGSIGIVVVCLLANGLSDTIARTIVKVVLSVVVYAIVQRVFHNECFNELYSSVVTKYKRGLTRE